MSSKPKVGTLLHCEDGSALVVEEGTTPLAGLLDMLVEGYGGERFAPDNPAIVKALESTVVERWFYNTAEQMENGDVDPDLYVGGWWSSGGAGKRWITVCYYPNSVYQLGEDADAAEKSSVAAGVSR